MNMLSIKNAVFWDVKAVSEERIAPIIRVRIGELGTTLAVTGNSSTLRSNIIHPDDGDDTFLRNVGSYKSHTT
jgi:hypothetical protein